MYEAAAASLPGGMQLLRLAGQDPPEELLVPRAPTDASAAVPTTTPTDAPTHASTAAPTSVLIMDTVVERPLHAHGWGEADHQGRNRVTRLNFYKLR